MKTSKNYTMGNKSLHFLNFLYSLNFFHLLYFLNEIWYREKEETIKDDWPTIWKTYRGKIFFYDKTES